METKITKIGNSQGIIIPKNIIQQCKFKDIVKLEVKDNCLLVSHQNTFSSIFNSLQITIKENSR